VRARDDDGEPLEHRTARVNADLETWNVPWTPEEDEAFERYQDQRLARAIPLAPVPAPPGVRPSLSPHGPDADGADLPEAA
jgi:hypothetical protein